MKARIRHIALVVLVVALAGPGFVQAGSECLTGCPEWGAESAAPCCKDMAAPMEHQGGAPAAPDCNDGELCSLVAGPDARLAVVFPQDSEPLTLPGGLTRKLSPGAGRSFNSWHQPARADRAGPPVYLLNCSYLI